MSCSWGGGSSCSVLNDEISYALELGRNGLGCVVVFSTGNDNSSVNYPANSNSDIIAVGAMSPCGERKNPSSCDGENWGSNYGSTLDLVLC
ncbi:MAG: S8 family serine peptidase [Prolixibacteraceae bacterium]|nr:S8 family serine peptidase [Prolixibacteraceae bacterium]